MRPLSKIVGSTRTICDARRQKKCRDLQPGTGRPASRPGSQPQILAACQKCTILNNKSICKLIILARRYGGVHSAGQSGDSCRDGRLGSPSQPARQPGSQPGSQAARQPARQAASQPASQPTIQPACQIIFNQPGSQPTSQLAGLPASQPASQPARANQPASQPNT